MPIFRIKKRSGFGYPYFEKNTRAGNRFTRSPREAGSFSSVTDARAAMKEYGMEGESYSIVSYDGRYRGCESDSMTWVETFHGHCVDFLDPDPGQIVLGDIGRGLSRVARFNGHTKGGHPYSVAQHSVWCSLVAGDVLGAPITTQLHVLMHDAHEAYTGDIVRPLKAALNGVVNEIEDRLQAAINTSFGLPEINEHEATLITRVDELALVAEAATLVHSGGADWDLPDDVPEWVRASIHEVWSGDRAEREFLAEYGRLSISELWGS